MKEKVQSKKRNQTAEERAKCVPKTDVERFEIKNIVATKYLKGFGAYDIQRHCLSLGHTLSVKSVYNYINSLKKEWFENRMTAVDEVIAQQLAKIDNVEREAWDAWENSKKEKQKAFNKTIFDGAEPKPGQKPKIKSNEASKTIEASEGNAEFLKVVQWCIDKRLEIIGFGKLNINIQNNSVTNVENRISHKFSGNVTIVRDVREKPTEIEVEDISPLVKEIKDENFS